MKTYFKGKISLFTVSNQVAASEVKLSTGNCYWSD